MLGMGSPIFRAAGYSKEYDIFCMFDRTLLGFVFVHSI